MTRSACHLQHNADTCQRMGTSEMESGHAVENTPDTSGDFTRGASPADSSRNQAFPDTAASCRLPSSRLNLNADDVRNGLGRLVLTLVKLLHELLERQALRRIDANDLSEAEIENLGLTFMKQAQEIENLRKVFNLEESDLNLDLGPLGKLL